jgi:DNA topoisomerase-6 subunit A
VIAWVSNSMVKVKDKAKDKQHAETQRERKRKVKELLISLGKKIYYDLDNGIFPEVHIPSRSVSNIVYDERLRQYILGKAKITRSSKNIRHLRSFTQLIWLAFFVDKLVNEGKTSTLRDVYYSSQAFGMDFEDQAESDHIITDLEALLSLAREDFNIYPEERSSIFGDLTIEYTVRGYEGRRLNLSDHPDGYLIGPSLSSAEFVDTSAELVIAVEKGGIFTRFVEENVHKRFKAIIVDTAGQAPRATRYLLKRLNNELKLPVYILTDGDVYGEHIAMVIKSGSANAAHLRDLTVPDAKWIGVWASDIQKYKLPTDPMTEHDIKRCYELKQDPRYQSDIWKRELELFMKIKRKSELEAFAKYGLTKITDDYLPEKLEEAKSL